MQSMQTRNFRDRWSRLSMMRISCIFFALLFLGATILPAQEISGTVALEQSLVVAIARAERSVVAVARVRKEQPGELFPLEIRPDPFGRSPLLPAAPQPTDPDFLPNEYASGVIVDSGGLILTSYRVLADDSEYYVTTADHRIYKATPRAADPRSDLAVLAVAASGLPPIALGDASTLRKGRIVIALGNPFAIARDGQASASWGIISNLGRKAPKESSDVEPSGKTTLHHFGTLIQTDAKLHWGGSGGALVDLQGQMVGLTVAYGNGPGMDAGGGFAIPVDATFRRVLDVLKQGREAEYGFLGVQPSGLTRQEVFQGIQGIRVLQAVPGTPADKFGVRAGDVITAVDGTPIDDPDGLIREVGKLPPESRVTLRLVRQNRIQMVSVTLGKYPIRGKKIVTQPEPAWRGLRVDYPTAVLDQQGRGILGITFADGVAVAEVAENSPPFRAGLRRGTLITHVGRTPVTTPAEFRRAIINETGPVTLRAVQENKNVNYTVEAE
jgi:serine protease Do